MDRKWRVRLMKVEKSSWSFNQNFGSKNFDFPKSPKNLIFGRFGEMNIFDRNFSSQFFFDSTFFLKFFSSQKNNLIFGSDPKILRLVFFSDRKFSEKKVFRGKSINRFLSWRRDHTRVEIVTDFLKFPTQHEHFFTNTESFKQTCKVTLSRGRDKQQVALHSYFELQNELRLSLDPFGSLSQQCLFTEQTKWTL